LRHLLALLDDVPSCRFSRALFSSVALFQPVLPKRDEPYNAPRTFPAAHFLNQRAAQRITRETGLHFLCFPVHATSHDATR
jgi:hypothetical protein